MILLLDAGRPWRHRGSGLLWCLCFVFGTGHLGCSDHCTTSHSCSEGRRMGCAVWWVRYKRPPLPPCAIAFLRFENTVFFFWGDGVVSIGCYLLFQCYYSR
ncbi:unnamed protein product [Chondrus crispus]|uniref:Secreted protein n=1 Tax=Chondrus crispus TaxID=2769 RepID=R7QK09_CHOCR|nr:unnamed protein product [Chondrus crispus]CDF38857.1 unnamed protein product [Chondrus crispus]|eukprot:XP_005718762.1 unnamed protein product [Chondrus crispus]